MYIIMYYINMLLIIDMMLLTAILNFFDIQQPRRSFPAPFSFTAPLRKKNFSK
jgi:hypothetical protein